MPLISASVGDGATNKSHDVALVHVPPEKSQPRSRLDASNTVIHLQIAGNPG